MRPPQPTALKPKFSTLMVALAVVTVASAFPIQEDKDVNVKSDAVQYQFGKQDSYNSKPDSFLYIKNDFGSDGYAGSPALADSGPSDQIHDLHAKYQAAVNKAENVAQAALRAAGDALNEQSNKEKPSSTDSLLLDSPSFAGGRYKRAVGGVMHGPQQKRQRSKGANSKSKAKSRRAKKRRDHHNVQTDRLESERVVMGESSVAAAGEAEEDLEAMYADAEALSEAEDGGMLLPEEEAVLGEDAARAEYEEELAAAEMEEEGLEVAAVGAGDGGAVGDENSPMAVRVKQGEEPVMKLRAGPATKISPEKIDTMIDLMNSLNQQFAKMISNWDKMAAEVGPSPGPPSNPGPPPPSGAPLARDDGPPPLDDPGKMARMEEDPADDDEGPDRGGGGGGGGHKGDGGKKKKEKFPEDDDRGRKRDDKERKSSREKDGGGGKNRMRNRDSDREKDKDKGRDRDEDDDGKSDKDKKKRRDDDDEEEDEEERDKGKDKDKERGRKGDKSKERDDEDEDDAKDRKKSSKKKGRDDDDDEK